MNSPINEVFWKLFQGLKLQNLLRKTLIALVVFYKNYISVFLGPRCRFHPTCSTYCLGCLNKFSISKALWYSSVRIIKCQPLHPGGYDPIPHSDKD